MKNYYFDNTNELKPFTHELEANDESLAPDNALRIAPEFKEGYHPCVKGNKWVLIEDNRGKTVYNIETKEPITIDYLGEIKKDFTLLEPFDFCIWNDKEWVLNSDEKNAFAIKQNQSIKESLLAEANEKIVILQDIVDFDMQESNEDEQLKSWKKYRILLTRIDTSTVEVVFPEKP